MCIQTDLKKNNSVPNVGVENAIKVTISDVQKAKQCLKEFCYNFIN